MNLSIMAMILTNLPKLIEAVQTILSSDAVHTLETAFEEFLNHNTAGKQTSPALGPDAPIPDLPKLSFTASDDS